MSRRSSKASSPRISRILGLSFLAFGGVLGKVKLNNPRVIETIAAR